MVHPSAARQQLHLCLERLRALPFHELCALPEAGITDIPFGGQMWSLTTYRGIDKDGVRIIAQIGPPQPPFLLVHVQADGFRMSRDGTVHRLADRDLDEYR